MEGLKNEFELAMVNEPSVFELLRFDCICILGRLFATKHQNFLKVVVHAIIIEC